MSSEVLTIEIADTSLSELANLVNEIKSSFNDLLEPLKEIRDILAEAFKPDPLKDFIGTMADIGSVIIGLVGLVAAIAAIATASIGILVAAIVNGTVQGSAITAVGAYETDTITLTVAAGDTITIEGKCSGTTGGGVMLTKTSFGINRLSDTISKI